VRWGEALTYDTECAVDCPYAGRKYHHDHIFLPDGDSSTQRKYPSWGDNHIVKEWKTYTRSTSKSEAEETAK